MAVSALHAQKPVLPAAAFQVMGYLRVRSQYLLILEKSVL
jgi:hypothetical protein